MTGRRERNNKNERSYIFLNHLFMDPGSVISKLQILLLINIINLNRYSLANAIRKKSAQTRYRNQSLKKSRIYCSTLPHSQVHPSTQCQKFQNYSYSSHRQC